MPFAPSFRATSRRPACLASAKGPVAVIAVAFVAKTAHCRPLVCGRAGSTCDAELDLQVNKERLRARIARRHDRCPVHSFDLVAER